jgi:hypothetical protein
MDHVAKFSVWSLTHSFGSLTLWWSRSIAKDVADLFPSLDLVGATPDYIRLRCTKDEFEKLNPAEATDYSPGPGGYGVPQPLVHDTVPAGDVAVHGGHHVHATDGDIGKVQGLVIDPASHQVSHFLLQEGHLWGRKRVAIPISAVAGLATGLRLNLSKEQVQDLPSAEIEELSPVKKG